MIPKIIHFCWLSNEAYPSIVNKCISSWKKKLPDYQFILWDTKRFDINSSLWTKQAFKAKKYAFVADYIRLYAVYKYGGIYLDTDVEVRKNFNNLLELPYFIGNQYDELIEAAVFGAKKESEWVLNCLKYYDNRAFIKENGQMDLLILPEIMKKQIKQQRKLITMKPNETINADKILKDSKSFFLFPFEYFSPKNHQNREVYLSKKTYTIHHYNSSWLPVLSKFRLKFIRFIGINNTEKLINLLGIRKLNNNT